MNNKQWNILEWGTFAVVLLLLGVMVTWLGWSFKMTDLSVTQRYFVYFVTGFIGITAIIGLLGWFRKDGPLTWKKVMYAILILCGIMAAKALREYFR